MSVIAVVGASGRVGSAVTSFLELRHEVRKIGRPSTETALTIAAQCAGDASVILNFAGLAHVDHDSTHTATRLHAANVELPLSIASAALEVGASMVHLSSVKATSPSDSAYAASKRDGDDALQQRFGEAFLRAEKALVILRPPALLFPPLDAGKIRHLRFLRHVPAILVPDVRLPVLTTETFERTVGTIVADLLSEEHIFGYSVREFPPANRGTLRDVAKAFRVRASRSVPS